MRRGQTGRRHRPWSKRDLVVSDGDRPESPDMMLLGIGGSGSSCTCRVNGITTDSPVIEEENPKYRFSFAGQSGLRAPAALTGGADRPSAALLPCSPDTSSRSKALFRRRGPAPQNPSGDRDQTCGHGPQATVTRLVAREAVWQRSLHPLPAFARSSHRTTLCEDSRPHRTLRARRLPASRGTHVAP